MPSACCCKVSPITWSTGLAAGSTRSLLHKAIHRGLVARLKSGLFTLVPQELGSETEFSGNPYLAARALVGESPYYLSHATAMELHRMVTQPRLGIFISTSKRMVDRVMHSTEYKFIFIRPEQIFGTVPHWVTKQEQVILSDVERTVIDGLRRPEYCGGITEVARGLWMRHEDIKVEKLIQYATRLKVGAVIRRFGVFAGNLSSGKPGDSRPIEKWTDPNVRSAGPTSTGKRPVRQSLALATQHSGR
jgi:predicted transcriptional regulator of viral defense system